MVAVALAILAMLPTPSSPNVVQERPRGPLPSFAADVERVVLAVGVLDGNGSPATGLDIEDFIVFEDGVAQRVTGVVAADDTPLKLALALDVSGSVEDYEAEIISGARSFIDLLVPRDCVALMHFAGTVEPAIWGRPQEPQLHAAVPLKGWLAGGTAVYDAIMASLVSVEPDSPAAWSVMEMSTIGWADESTSGSARFQAGCRSFLGESGRDREARRRAVVVVTDGEDVTSRFSYAEALTASWETNVPVFVLAVGTLARPSRRLGFGLRGQRVMPNTRDIIREQIRDLAEISGGEFIKAASPGAVQSAFDKILTRLRAYYLVTFEPSPGNAGQGRWHEIEVKLRPRGLSSFHAPRYFRSVADPRAARRAVRRGLEHLDAGRADEALLEFEHSTWADPDFADGYYHAARALQRKGRAGDALAAFRRAWDRAPGAADRQIAELSLDVGELDGAWQHAIQAHIAGHDMSDVLQRLDQVSDAPVDLQERLSAPRVFVPAGLFADPAWRGDQDRLVRSLRFAVWEYPGLGLVQDSARAEYLTKLVVEKPPEADLRSTTLQFELYTGAGRVFRQKLKVHDIGNDEALRAVFAEVLSGLSLRR